VQDTARAFIIEPHSAFARGYFERGPRDLTKRRVVAVERHRDRGLDALRKPDAPNAFVAESIREQRIEGAHVEQSFVDVEYDRWERHERRVRA